MSPWPLTSAPAGAICCNRACSVSSRSGSFSAQAALPRQARQRRTDGCRRAAWATAQDQLRTLRAREVLLALVQLGLAVQHGKQVAKLADALGGAEKQHAAGFQRVVEQRNELLLQFHAHVDQQVAAADQVQPGERRVLDHVLLGEDQHVADALVDAVALPPGSAVKKRASRSGVRSVAMLAGYRPTRAVAMARLSMSVAKTCTL